jgi:hypothetical protein
VQNAEQNASLGYTYVHMHVHMQVHVRGAPEALAFGGRQDRWG